MAKKKKTTYRRRRRVSGIGQNLDLQAMGLAVAGAVAADLIKTQLEKSTKESTQKMAPYAGLVAGVALAALVKNPMVKAASIGMVAYGGVLAARAAKILKGIGAFDNAINYAPLPYRMTGRQQNVVNGANFSGSGLRQASVISGIGANCFMNGAGAPFH